MKAYLLIIAAFLTLCTFSCAHKGKAPVAPVAPPPGAAREFSNPSETIRVAAGEKFSIVLDSNATTGYSWQIAKKTVGPVVKFISRDYEEPRAKLAGAGGKERLRFMAAASGMEKLTFHYLRTWEKNIEPARTVTFTVVVK